VDSRNLCVMPVEEKQEETAEQSKLSFLDRPVAAIPLPDISQLSSSPARA